MVVMMVDVVSSNIAQVGYHAETGTMTVVFKSGAVYHYLSLEPEVFAELLDSESKGRFLNSRVKGHYEYQRLDSEEPSVTVA